jgi:hypothetical protein
MGPNERSLLKAAGQNDLNEVARLIREGANPSAINDEGEGPLTSTYLNTGRQQTTRVFSSTSLYIRPSRQETPRSPNFSSTTALTLTG